VRRILGISPLSEDEIRSELERLLLRICRAAGLPEPAVNRWIVMPDVAAGGFEVDFCWPRQRLIVETDSRAHHDTDRAFENDPHRDRLLTMAGWRVVRFTYRDLTERRAEVAAQLRRLLTDRTPRAPAPAPGRS
jgi:very-short-patch-repair endonuclease